MIDGCYVYDVVVTHLEVLCDGKFLHIGLTLDTRTCTEPHILHGFSLHRIFPRRQPRHLSFSVTSINVMNLGSYRVIVDDTSPFVTWNGALGNGSVFRKVKSDVFRHDTRLTCVRSVKKMAGHVITLIQPALGWSPRPKNSPGGSMLKLANCTV